MSYSRPIIPGKTHFISRSIFQQTYFLKPRAIVEQVFTYVVAVAAKKYKMDIHGMVVLSNHWHCLLTDPHGNLPEFLRYVHEFTSKILNISLGRRENFWSSEKASIVTLEGDEDICDKLTYLMANPVSAQLVEYGCDWPGIRKMWQAKGHSVRVKRPKIYYSKTGKMPKKMTLKFTRPPIFSEMSDNKLSGHLRELVNAREDLERAKIAEVDGGYLGAKAVCRQDIYGSPTIKRTGASMNPRIGAKSRWRMEEAKRRNRDWLRAYKDALKEWRDGNTEAVFPAGTYALRRFGGVCCESFG